MSEALFTFPAHRKNRLPGCSDPGDAPGVQVRPARVGHSQGAVREPLCEADIDQNNRNRIGDDGKWTIQGNSAKPLLRTVLDRPGLEARACECYQVVKTEFDRLLPYVVE